MLECAHSAAMSPNLCIMTLFWRAFGKVLLQNLSDNHVLQPVIQVTDEDSSNGGDGFIQIASLWIFGKVEPQDQVDRQKLALSAKFVRLFPRMIC